MSIAAFILANDIVAPHDWAMPQRTCSEVSGKKDYLKAVKAIVDGKSDKSRTVVRRARYLSRASERQP